VRCMIIGYAWAERNRLMTQEFRVAVGTPDGVRSNVWKMVVANDDSIYIMTRLSSDTKISLHPSGDCQFSGTSAWVVRDPTRRNQDRHFVKWVQQRPLGRTALHAVQIRIPHSELIRVDVAEDLSDAHWSPAPGEGRMTAINCYITPPAPRDPAVDSALSFTHLVSMQLPATSWLVVGLFEEPCDQASVESARTSVQQYLLNNGREWLPQHRACVIIEGHATCKAFMELSSPLEYTAAAVAIRS
jgi:hypothetical protein